MIIVCSKHVKEGLEIIHLPHIHFISNEDKEFGNYRCHICCEKADYKLFNFFPQKKLTLENVI
jgi:hypothetical protein